MVDAHMARLKMRRVSPCHTGVVDARMARLTLRRENDAGTPGKWGEDHLPLNPLGERSPYNHQVDDDGRQAG